MYLKKLSKTIQSKHTGPKSEVSAGAVVFFIENNTIMVLQLIRARILRERQQKVENIDIGPKGHLKPGESPLQAAHRELQEETGISPHIDTNFKETLEYIVHVKDSAKNKVIKINKTSIYFLAFLHKTERKNIVVSEEHKGYYFVPIDKAIDKITFPESKQLLKDAKAYITEKYLSHEIY